MSLLVRTPVVDRNGRQTHVYKNDIGIVSTRAIPSVAHADSMRYGVNYSDYIGNIWKSDNSAFSNEEITAAKNDMRVFVDDLIDDMNKNSEWLPEIDSYDEDSADDDGYISEMSDLTIPENSRGMCVHVSEAVQAFIKNKRKENDGSVVQGLSIPHPDLNVHYANLFAPEDEPALVVDFTYSQIDEMEEFPLILTPDEWVLRIQEDLKKSFSAN